MSRQKDLSDILIDIIKAAAIAIIGYIVIRGLIQATTG